MKKELDIYILVAVVITSLLIGIASMLLVAIDLFFQKEFHHILPQGFSIKLLIVLVGLLVIAEVYTTINRKTEKS